MLAVLAACACSSSSSSEGGSSGDTTTTSSSTTEPATTAPATDASGSTTSTGVVTSADSSSSSGPSETTDSSSTGGSTGTPTAGIAFETTLGTIVFELDEVAAPITSANFLEYVEGGFFDGTDGNGATIFHRVVPGFVIQGGGFTEALQQKATLPPIDNESGNGLANVRGAISMARTPDPDSATSQFFINLIDNDFLDDPPGYAVFGSVVEGMEVVDAMAAVATATMGPLENVPIEPIVVLSVTVQ